MDLLQNRGDEVHGGGFSDYMSCRNVNHLKLVEGFVSETERKGITIIDMGGDEAMNKRGGD